MAILGVDTIFDTAWDKRDYIEPCRTKTISVEEFENIEPGGKYLNENVIKKELDFFYGEVTGRIKLADGRTFEATMNKLTPAFIDNLVNNSDLPERDFSQGIWDTKINEYGGESIEITPAVTRCAHCGVKAREGDRMCTQCGAPL